MLNLQFISAATPAGCQHCQGWILKAGTLMYLFTLRAQISKLSTSQQTLGAPGGFSTGNRAGAAGTLDLCQRTRRKQCGYGLVFACCALFWDRLMCPGRTSCVLGGCLLLEQMSYWKMSLSNPASPVCCSWREQDELWLLGNVFSLLWWVHE